MAQLTIQQAFDLALRHHQAGRLQEAEQLYRQILAQQPRHADAIHHLGVIALQEGRDDMALDLIRRAIALNPGSSEAHSNFGTVLKGKGQLDEAIAAYRQAIALKPNYAEAYSNLGNALSDKGQLDEAIAAYRQAIALRPNFAEAHNSLGNALKGKERLDEAIAAYRQAIALRTNYAEAHSNLGNALKGNGQLDEAIAAYRQAIALKSNFAEAHNNLGNALQKKGEFDNAIAAYRQAIALKPKHAEAYNNLGSVLGNQRQLDEAIALYYQAIALRPNYAEAYNNLGNALSDKGQLEEAIAAYRQAIALRPNSPETYSNLGNVEKKKGALDEAIAAYRQAVALKPNHAEADSNLVYTLHFSSAYDARAIAEEHRRWNQQHAEPLRKFIQPHTNDRDPNRRLRIGYVSPDFREHVVGRNLLPLFRRHDHQQFEITCYAQVPSPDARTSQFQQTADRWRNIVGLPDDQVATQIREDRIDLLVDLAMHMANNRLLVFARRPAPVQVTFAGYPAGTGLNAIDYRLSDPYLDPPDMDESVYTERTIRLPDSFWCYDPLEDRGIPVNSLPALNAGFVTFGCLNNFCKVNDGVLTLWGRVLRQVENSRLLLLAHPGSHRQRTLDRLRQEGIDPGRVEFVPFLPRPTYLELHHRIDLGLDTFPYNGHTTSLDSFWMGVPVVTLVGQRAVSRAGWCQLSNLGLPELAAQTAEQFVRIAVEIAKDLPRLEQLRSTLRRRMEQSPMMDAPKFARNIEAAYRRMWHTWCQRSGS